MFPPSTQADHQMSAMWICSFLVAFDGLIGMSLQPLPLLELTSQSQRY